MSWGEFKSTANDVGNWIWGGVTWTGGMLAGGFNDKQSIGQITTDAVISMFPILGEATATRDVIACSLRLCEYPEKREEVMEWVALTLPLLALVPLFGGVLKGVGKLLLKAGKNVNEDRKILEAMVSLLNRVGHGNAVRFIKELDFTRYAKPITEGVRQVCTRIRNTLVYVQKKMDGRLPQALIDRFTWLREQLDAVQALAGKMVPQALKDLNNRLKYVQALMYQGEWHVISGTGKAITRATEARLVTKAGKMEWELKDAPFPQNTKKAFVPKAGWPDLEKGGKYFKELETGNDYYVIRSFHGPMTAVELTEGMTIYRVIDHKFGHGEGAYWMYLDPKSIKGRYWRIKFAVLQKWSHNGKYVQFTVPKGKTLRVWEGKVSSQIDNGLMRSSREKRGLEVVNEGFGQFVDGGETQLFIDFGFPANQWAEVEVQALPKLDTHWVDHMDVNLVPTTADVQKLGEYVEEQKTLASANLATAANEAGKAVRAANER